MLVLTLVMGVHPKPQSKQYHATASTSGSLILGEMWEMRLGLRSHMQPPETSAVVFVLLPGATKPCWQPSVQVLPHAKPARLILGQPV